MQMRQKSFYIDESTYSDLSRVATAENLAIAELMRRLIREGLTLLKGKSNQTTSFLQKLGRYQFKGPKDLSQSLDRYAWD